jgi:hypothetical protein
MRLFVTRHTLDDLVELWHDGAWPGLELEELIREATNWSHNDYDRWAATGASPDEPTPFAERDWCGHDPPPIPEPRRPPDDQPPRR